jgi:dTDP-glucose pyrophosphorylase
MTKKIIIMAAGKGTRLMPLTKFVPKVLININGKPFLYYLIKNILKAGYTDIGIIAGYKKEKIEEFLKEFKFSATIIEQKETLGTGHAIKQIKEFVGKDSFVVIGGDNLFSTKDLGSISGEDDYNHLVGMEHPSPEKYGVLKVEGEKLIRIIEKPIDFVGNLINIGLYKFTPEIFKALNKIKLSERGEYELTDAITLLAKEGKVKVHKLKDYWLDLGGLDDIPKVEQFLKKR